MLYRDIIPQLLTQPQVQMDYYLTDRDISRLDTDELEKYDVKPVTWGWSGEIPNQIVNADLLILSRSLHDKDNISQCLQKAKQIIKDNGFILIQELTQRFHIPLALKGQCKDYSKLSDKAKRTIGPFQGSHRPDQLHEICRRGQQRDI